MADYTPIPFAKEAVQLEIPEIIDGKVPETLPIGGSDLKLYRDRGGFYILVPTERGEQRANPTDWVMLERDIIPAQPQIPEVPAVAATGTFLVAELAAGDGQVGFSYKGIVYAVDPAASQTAEETALALTVLVNLGGQLTAVVNGSTVELTKIVKKTAGNRLIIDESTDTAQIATLTGLSGGSNYAPPIPAQPEQHALFSVWTDALFVTTFQLV